VSRRASYASRGLTRGGKACDGLASSIVCGSPAHTESAATLKDKDGKEVASAQRYAGGALIRLELDGVPPGDQAFHIHAVAKCGSLCTSRKRGSSPWNTFVTLDDEPASLLDEDGSALVIHANADDYETDPSGNAGDHIACGVISR
jgi:Cu-Zn family superoxide dismutase